MDSTLLPKVKPQPEVVIDKPMESQVKKAGNNSKAAESSKHPVSSLSPNCASTSVSLEYSAYENGRLHLNDRYKYLAPIQKGSFGCVTLAVDLETNTKVALKAMHRKKDVEPMARHEIKVLTKLGRGNPNICQLLDSFETNDFVVLVLEYCSAGDLHDVIHSNHGSPRAVDVWNLAREMHSGLSYAHSLGIYHRDLKPENILFTESGSAKICDWGLATFVRQSTVFNVGTERYMAPECFLHTPFSSGEVINSYDCKYADYWSFGITLLTAVFGTSPFKPIVATTTSSGSVDPFKLKKKGPRKLLESDSNFKNFVFYNKSEVLYDIYPSMNSNCFSIFMNLLKIGGADDGLDNYLKKIQLRDLDKFVNELEANWKYGLTVWEEEEFGVDSDDESVCFKNQTHHDSVFDMDDFDGSKAKSSSSADVSELPGLPSSLDKHIEAADARSEHDILTYNGLGQARNITSMPVPSLLESSFQPKSWYDLEDDIDDVEFNRIFNSLSFRSEPRKGDWNIQIVEKELVEDSISWNY